MIDMEKEKVISILKDLKNHWDLAEWMIALIEAGFMDKETYQNTLFMITTAIKQMPEWTEKTKLQSKLMKLRNAENKINKNSN